MGDRSINVNRNTLLENMLRTHRSLVILAIIGYLALPSGTALECYVCTPNEANGYCQELSKSEKITCSAPQPPTDQPTTTPKPTNQPTTTPKPTNQPTTTPKPTNQPTTTPKPTNQPTTTPKPTNQPTTTPKPADQPTTTPKPANQPTTTPKPADQPTTTPKPANQPTTRPKPTNQPTTTPKPTDQPTTTPKPTDQPTTTPKPDNQPTTPSKLNETTSKARNQFSRDDTRKRRSVLDRFSRLHPFEDAASTFCFSGTTKVNNTDAVVRGCSLQNSCPKTEGNKELENCKICNSNLCNSAGSHIVFTSMIISLVVAVLFTK